MNRVDMPLSRRARIVGWLLLLLFVLTLAGLWAAGSWLNDACMGPNGADCAERRAQVR